MGVMSSAASFQALLVKENRNYLASRGQKMFFLKQKLKRAAWGSRSYIKYVLRSGFAKAIMFFFLNHIC